MVVECGTAAVLLPAWGARVNVSATALRVLRNINGDGGKEIRTEVQRRAAGQLVLAGYARKLKTKYKITAEGRKVLKAHEPQNPYGDVGAW